jgi:hypothetical protein
MTYYDPYGCLLEKLNGRQRFKNNEAWGNVRFWDFENAGFGDGGIYKTEN